MTESKAVSPLTLKPEPMRLACEMVALAVPVLLTPTGNVLLVPTVTFPNSRCCGANHELTTQAAGGVLRLCCGQQVSRRALVICVNHGNVVPIWLES